MIEKFEEQLKLNPPAEELSGFVCKKGARFPGIPELDLDLRAQIERALDAKPAKCDEMFPR